MAREDYGSEGSVPSVAPVTGSSGGLNVQANPSDFGAQVGEAKAQFGGQVQKLGGEAMALADMYGKMATEAKANEAITKEWAPKAAQLRSDFDSKRGQDKIAAYDPYISSLKDEAQSFINDASSPYEKVLRSGWVSHHVAQEVDGARREQVAAMHQFEDDAHSDRLLMQAELAIKNYANPDIAASANNQAHALILKHAIDRGANPNDPDDARVIREQQRQYSASAAYGAINQAVTNGDVNSAAAIYNKNKQILPGYQQISLDHLIHTAAIDKTSNNNTHAIILGSRMPPAIARAPVEVIISVAKAAENSGIDPNHALAVARIESAYGTNVGSRGDIGQTGKPGDLDTQSANMVSELKKSQEVASNALGRPADPWEQYLCYQQGAGGGPALLKANPSMRAIDALVPLYKDRDDAISAILNNGGNASMSCRQFLDFIKSKYEGNAARARYEVTGGQQTISDSIANQYNISSEAVQPAATPRQALFEFDKVYSNAIQLAEQIPNVDERAGTIAALNRKRQGYVASAGAYDSVLINQAQQLAADPHFTSMDQVPVDLQSALLSDHPLTLNYLEQKAEQNLDKASGSISKDQKTYGPAMFDLMRGIHDGTIKDQNDLLEHLPNRKTGYAGDLTIAGYEKLLGEFKKDPEKASEARIRTEAFAAVKSKIMNTMYGIRDPEGMDRWSVAMPKLFEAWDKGIAEKVPVSELADPTSPKYFGNSVKSLVRSPVQKALDSRAVRPLSAMLADYKLATLQWRKDMLLQEMRDAGYNIVDDTQPPTAQAPVSK